MTQLAGSIALITGGASGIGRLMGLELARRGARVVVWDLDAAALDAVVSELDGATGRASAGMVCDISDRHAVYAAAERVRAEVGPVDIVVNNAGVVSGRPFQELSDEAIERTFQVNTLALFWTAKAFLPGMVERGRGHIVTIASASGLVGVPRLVDYAASKHAAVGFDESLRMELRETAPGVKTTVVCPYYIDTGMFAGVRTRFPALLPILEPGPTARRIIDAIEADEERLILPPSVRLLPVFRALPTALFDRGAEWLGVTASMDAFHGRGKGPRSRP
ncbi:MAG: SDR family oxidoreductase [Deltaproteobacteria bacterium]|nr:SDR family oxidoreductase [Deltaproteobacteria bacterium]MCB9788969.1 SDR family oxidoreductase [Deltaproteobacteria bacterium]